MGWSGTADHSQNGFIQFCFIPVPGLVVGIDQVMQDPDNDLQVTAGLKMGFLRFNLLPIPFTFSTDTPGERPVLPGHSQGAGHGCPAPGGRGMSVDEAYDVLGLRPGASKDEIREAHHKLMLKNHPDHGGSTYIAAKLNQAKEILLGG